MSNWLDATRARIEPDLICPCGAENVPGKPYVITLEDRPDYASCDVCGRRGPLIVFVRPSYVEPH